MRDFFYLNLLKLSACHFYLFKIPQFLQDSSNKMIINIQQYFVRLFFAIMIFICAYHGMVDARSYDSKSDETYSKYPDGHHSDSRNHEERFG